MSFGCKLFDMMNADRSLDFSISDVILVLFLHDLEKPFRYTEPKYEFSGDEDKKIFINDLIDKYKIILNDSHKNALMYIHGEGDDFDRIKRVQKPLAAFVHVCDVISARIWFDYPKNK